MSSYDPRRNRRREHRRRAREPFSPSVTRTRLLPTFQTVRIDCRAAEKIRLTVVDLGRRLGAIETAFVLWGDAPRGDRSARITDVEPMDSHSSPAGVEADPEATMKAVEALVARHPGEPFSLLGIAHNHPGPTKPARSFIDHRWHAQFLSMNSREELLVSIEADREPVRVSYSLIFPCQGVLSLATGYLITRGPGAPPGALREFEIGLRYSETEAAFEALRGVDVRLESRGHSTLISYSASEGPASEGPASEGPASEGPASEGPAGDSGSDLRLVGESGAERDGERFEEERSAGDDAEPIRLSEVNEERRRAHGWGRSWVRPWSDRSSSSVFSPVTWGEPDEGPDPLRGRQEDSE